MLAGVCAVIARQLRAPRALVRILAALWALLLFLPAALITITAPADTADFSYPVANDARLILLPASAVILLYTVLWWALPDDDAQRRSAAVSDDLAAVRGMPERARRVHRRPLPVLVGRWIALSCLVGATAMTVLASAGADLLLIADQSMGILVDDSQWYGGFLLLLFSGMCAGVAFGLLPLDDLDEGRWSGTLPLLALGVGIAGLFSGTIIMVTVLLGMRIAALLLLTVLGVLGLLALLLVPWGRRLWGRLREEAAQRAVVQHHRETTAHLHDSVLQTLAVMQRPGKDAEEIRRLARRQERELRRWLYQDGATDEAPTELRAAVVALTAELEDAHGTDVHTVVVGEATLSEQMRPLLGALREATVNACRHGRDGVDVFVDVAEDRIEAFVRDRGPGFDLSRVPEDRLGVRESIIGRMQRAGGSALVHPAPGGGTEVALTLPLRRR